MMTVEDYLKLPKRRLAELLVEKEQSLPTYTPRIVGYSVCPHDGKECFNNYGCLGCARAGITITTTSNDTGIEPSKFSK